MLRGSGLDLGPVHPRSKVSPVVPLSKARPATNKPLDGVTRDRGECGSEPGCGISIGSGNVDGNGTAAVLPSLMTICSFNSWMKPDFPPDFSYGRTPTLRFECDYPSLKGLEMAERVMMGTRSTAGVWRVGDWITIGNLVASSPA